MGSELSAATGSPKQVEVQWRFMVPAGAIVPYQALVEGAALSLRINGFCLVEGADPGAPLLPTDICEKCAESALNVLEDRLTSFENLTGRDPLRSRFGFDNICHFVQHRYELRVEGDEWRELRKEAATWADPVLVSAGLLGQQVRCGCAVVLPGSGAEDIRVDGQEGGYVNMLLPLVNVAAQNGPHEFLPESHRGGGEHSLLGPVRPSPEAPAMSRGSIALFDYRLQHRGLANRALAPLVTACFTSAMLPQDKTDGSFHNGSFPPKRPEEAAGGRYPDFEQSLVSPGSAAYSSRTRTAERRRILGLASR